MLLGYGKSKIEVAAELVFGEVTPPGLLLAIFSLYPHMTGNSGMVLFLFL